MMSAIAMFGEASSFALINASTNTTASFALAQACQHNLIPFSAFDAKSHTTACESHGCDDTRLLQIAKNSIDQTFLNTNDSVRRLSASM